MPSSAVGKAVPSHVRLVVLLGALSAFGPLSMDMYLPGLPSMARDLSAPAWAAQLTITTSMLGLAGGQLVAGPISDARGRRRPLLAGLAAYMATSLLCAVAPNIWMLLAFRLVQGAAGAAGIVIARAIVRDLHTGVAAARFFALLMLVGGLAPILAPLVGGELLHVTDWRGICSRPGRCWARRCPRTGATPAGWWRPSTSSAGSCATGPSWATRSRPG